MESKNVFIYSWSRDEHSIDATIIRAYGIDEKDENVCLIINNFRPYIYLELPDSTKWTDGLAQMLLDKINERCFDREANKDRRPIQSRLEYKKRLYYSHYDTAKNQHKLYPYLKCWFAHEDDIKFLNYKIRYDIFVPTVGKIFLKIQENNADCILQLTSTLEIPTTGWIVFTGKRRHENKKITNAKHEFECDWTYLKANSTIKVVGRPLVMSFDIEVYSSDPTRMPQVRLNEDRIFQVSCVFNRHGEQKYEKYLLTLGEAQQDLVGSDVKVIELKTEGDMLEEYAKLVNEKQPNVIVGYNIFGFDIPYMVGRADLGYAHDFLKHSMVRNQEAKPKEIKWSSSAYKNQEFHCLTAEGRIYVDLLPIVQRDLRLSNYKLSTVASKFLKNITKDPLEARDIFRCYDIGVKNIHNNLVKAKKAISLVGKYCVKDSELVAKLFNVLTVWVGLCEMSKITSVPVFDLFTRGQQIKVFSQVYTKCTKEGRVVERDKYSVQNNEHYIGATVFPPKPGIYDKVLPFDFNSLYPTTIIAYNLCWSTLVMDDTVPDSKCHVMEWDEHYGCEHDPKVVEEKELSKQIEKAMEKLKILRAERDSAKGSEKQEFKDRIEAVNAKLKPIRAKRAEIKKTIAKTITCEHRKYRWLKEPMGVLPEILQNLLTARKVTKSELDVIKGKIKVFTKEISEYELAVKKLNEEKKLGIDVSEEMEMYVQRIQSLENKNNENDEYLALVALRDVLDQRQNAMKLSANSGYGCLGVSKGGMLPFMPAAMCTTYMGRKAIEKAAHEIETKHGGELIYGDTDSNYVAFKHLKTAKECWDYATKVAEEVSKLYPKPMKLAYEEKIYWRFFIITKKRYMSLACEKDGNISKEINKKGVLLTRRDNCAFIRNIYSQVVLKLFNIENYDSVLYFIIGELNKLFSHGFPTSDFVITKAVGDVGVLGEIKEVEGKFKQGDYTVKKLSSGKTERLKELAKKDCENEADYYLSFLPAQVQLAERMRNRGQIVQAGSRLEYVITTQGGHTAKQCVKVEDFEYFSRHNSSLNIDYLYYLKQLSNPLDQILDIVYAKEEKYVEKFTLSQYKQRGIFNKVIEEMKGIFAPKIIVK